MNFKIPVLSLKLNKKLILSLIVIIFLATRLYRIDSIPASLYWDEASIGYNAYSILKTGQDEWGISFPLEFKAFGEYKLPVYIYSLVPLQAIFGPQNWVVRLPSVLFSLGSLVIVYFLSKKIFDNIFIGLLSSFLLLVSSWFFVFSRTGYEATAGVFFYLLGLHFFLSKDIKSVCLGLAFFVVSMFSYNSFRIIAPLSVLILYIPHIKNLKLLIPLVIFLVSSLMIFFMATKDGSERLKEIGIFTTDDKKKIVETFAVNYFSHFSPQFILQGDTNLRSQQLNKGQLYFIEIPIFLFGIIFILKSRKKTQISLVFLLLLSFLPAAITRESPHALRSILAAPLIAMISAYGIYRLYQFYKHKLIIYSIIILYLISFSYYYRDFLISYSTTSSNEWQFGYYKIFKDYEEKFKDFDQVVISDYYNQPYIFALYYLKYNPEKFKQQKIINTSSRKETSAVKSFDKFIFSSISYYDFPTGKSLIFAHPSERMDEINYVDTIKNLDGSLAFFVYEYEK